MGSETLITPHLITPKIPSRAVVGTEQQVSGNLSGAKWGGRGGEPSSGALNKGVCLAPNPFATFLHSIVPHKKPTRAGACL